jgi:aminodeoxyfutalosine deaminase
MVDSNTLTARYVFPVAGPPLERGLVTVAGDRIAAVEPHGARSPDFDCRDAAIVPGFVNTHTHLDLSGARGQTRPSPDFTGWLRRVIAFRRSQGSSQVLHNIRAGLRECARFGTTCIGDISGDGSSWAPVAQAPVWANVYRELIGLRSDRLDSVKPTLSAWLRDHPDTWTCRSGLSPHAPYSVHNFTISLARSWPRPYCIHLAETEAELELLSSHSGPFVAFLRDLDAWDPSGLVPDIDFILKRTRRRCKHPLYVHCNYLGADAPFLSSGSVVYCPRTHAAFSHPPHPFRDFLARGVRVALGTDSLASNPDLDLLAEARFVHTRHPDFSPAALLGMATLSGAEALGFAGATGSLEAGKSADLAIVALPRRDAADPHELLFASDRPVLATVFRGRRVIVDAAAPDPLPGLPFPNVTVG